MKRALAYLMSLVVLGAAVWMPTAWAQTIPGSWTPSGVVAYTNLLNQAWTQNQSFGGSNINFNNSAGLVWGSNAISARTQGAADALKLETSASRVVLITENADFATDFAIAAQTNPTLAIASATAGAEQRMFLRHNQTQGQVVDGANTATNQRPIGLHGGGAVASATTITPTGNVFHVTGTTSITGMTAMASGSCVTLIFDGALTFTDGAGTLRLSANLVSTADDTITLCCDGTNWFERGRSVN